MHLAVDTATFSIRSFGIFLILVGAIVAIATMISRTPWLIAFGVLPLIAGLPLAASRRWLLRRPTGQVRERMVRSLSLLGLPFDDERERNLMVRIPQLEIELRALGQRHTMVQFRSAKGPPPRERLVINALVKSQKTIRIII